MVVIELSLYRDQFLPNPVFYSKAVVPSLQLVQKLFLFLVMVYTHFAGD